MKEKKEHWIVEKEDTGSRLDVFVQRMVASISRREARRLIEAGRLWVNGHRTKQLSRALHIGDRVTLLVSPPPERPITEGIQKGGSSKSGENTGALEGTPKQAEGDAEDPRLNADPATQRPPFLFVDAAMAILNKPSGVPVEPTKAEDVGTCLRWLERWQRKQGIHPSKLYVVAAHRLDVGASGAVAFAFRRPAARGLSEQFASRQAKRIYWAIAVGDLPENEGRWEDFMAHTGPGVRRGVVKETYPDAKHAITDYRVLERFGVASLVEIRLQTGRTHQIRIHFSHHGHPLVGDWLYCDAEASASIPPATRLLLHARSLTLKHPLKEEMITVEAPLDQAFQDYLDLLRKKTPPLR
jgi:23S rRNA pseudouridine1911/1915/1917 synthase